MLNNHEEMDYFDFPGLSQTQKFLLQKQIQYLENQKLEFLEEMARASPNEVNVPIVTKCRKVSEYKRRKKVYEGSNEVKSSNKHKTNSSSTLNPVLEIHSFNASSITSDIDTHKELTDSPKKRGRNQKSLQKKEETTQPSKKLKTEKPEEKQTAKRKGKLLLNDAMSVLEQSKDNKKKKTTKKDEHDSSNNNNVLDESLVKAGWSDARLKAYKNKDKNPNAYYYRFNEPNEAQRTGEWDIGEILLFYKNILSLGVNYNWGLFSKNIQGRVGYQCSNYYRKLIMSNDIIDSCYYNDGKGLKFSHMKNNIKNYILLKPTDNKVKKLLKKMCGSENVIIMPNIKDPLTNERVINPEVDKTGNCMNSESWKKLKTYQKLNTVKLNQSNIDSYLNIIQEVSSVAYKNLNKKK